MDEKLRDAMVYLCQRYARERDMSNARMTKLVYLADWKCSIEHGRQLTAVEWMSAFGGVSGEAVEALLKADKAFETLPVRDARGVTGKFLLRVAKDAGSPSLSEEDRVVLDFVLETAERLDWLEFSRLVHSTYPVFSNDRDERLDLPGLAKVYVEDVRPMLDGSRA